MKAMDRVSRGNGFGGVLRYNLDPEKHTTIIGGNLSSSDAHTMSREFRKIAALRSDIKKPVWHQALRLPENEKITSEKLAEIAQAYMREMGFDTSSHQYVIVEDRLKKGQHAHIIANRVAVDGTVYLGKNENLISSRVCGELEVKFNLQQTKQATKTERRAKAKPKKKEIELALRTGEQPPKMQIQTICDSVLNGEQYSLDQFEAELYDLGVQTRRTANKNGLVGYSFSLDGEVWFKGSQLGKDYSKKRLLERGLNAQIGASQTLTSEANTNTAEHRESAQRTASRDSGTKNGHGRGQGILGRARDIADKALQANNPQPKPTNKGDQGAKEAPNHTDRQFNDLLGNANRIGSESDRFSRSRSVLAIAIFNADFKASASEYVRYHDKHQKRTLIDTGKSKGWVETTDNTAIAREDSPQANADILSAYALERGWTTVKTTSTDKEFLESFIDNCIERGIKIDLTPEQDKLMGWSNDDLNDDYRLSF